MKNNICFEFSKIKHSLHSIDLIFCLLVIILDIFFNRLATVTRILKGIFFFGFFSI